MQPVLLAELESIEGGFNWGAAAFVGAVATAETGNPVVGVVAAVVAGALL
jgi:hypothetical protein